MVSEEWLRYGLFTYAKSTEYHKLSLTTLWLCVRARARARTLAFCILSHGHDHNLSLCFHVISLFRFFCVCFIFFFHFPLKHSTSAAEFARCIHFSGPNETIYSQVIYRSKVRFVFNVFPCRYGIQFAFTPETREESAVYSRFHEYKWILYKVSKPRSCSEPQLALLWENARALLASRHYGTWKNSEWKINANEMQLKRTCARAHIDDKSTQMVAN